MKKKIAIVKRILAVLCVLALLFNNLPQTILATESETENEQPVEVTETPENTEEPTETPTETPAQTETPTPEPTEVPTETPIPEPTKPPIPDSTEGSPLDATDNVEVNIVKSGTTTAENLVVGSSDAKELSLTANVSGADSAEITWTAADGTAQGETPAAKAGAVTLSNADTDTVTITSNAGWQGGLVDVTAAVKYVIDGQEKTKSVTVPVTVWTDWGVSISVRTSTGAETSAPVELTNTLTPVFEAAEGADASEAKNAEEAFSYLWEKRRDELDSTGMYTYEEKARTKAYTPTEAGVYRFTSGYTENTSAFRNEYPTYTTEVTVVKIPVRLSWTSMSRPYDGTPVFNYSGSYTLTRRDESILAESVANPTSMTLELAGSNAGEYTVEELMPEEGTDFYNELTANYEIEEIEPLILKVEPCKLTPVVTAADKTYDGTTTVTGKISVNWKAENLDTSKFSLVTGEDNHVLTEKDLQLSSAGNVEEVTSVPVEGPKTVKIAIDGAVTGNYTAEVTYENINVKTITFKASRASLPEAVLVNKVYWVKNTPVVVNAAKNFFISATADGVFGNTANVAVDEQSNSVKAFIKNSKGRIGKVTIKNVKVDKNDPTVSAAVEEKNVLFIFNTSTMVCEFSDSESGINTESLYYYMAEPSENAPKFDESKWTKLTATESNGKYTAEIDLNEGLNKTVYVRALDKVGNETIKSFSRLIIEADKPNAPALTDKSEEESKNSRKTVNISVNDANSDTQAEENLKASGIQRVEYALLKDGEDVTPAKGISLADDSDLVLSSGSVSRKTDPENAADVLACASMDFDLIIDMKDTEMEGLYTLKVTAYDYCGNSSESETELLFDTMAPRVSVAMADGHEAAGSWYYKADNCGITVTFEDYTIAEGGTYQAAVRRQGQGAELKNAVISGTKATVEFSPEEVAALGDGVLEVIFNAEDAAGNKADSFAECTGLIAGTDNTNNPNARFVLDTTAPVVTKAVTKLDEEVNTGNLVKGTVYYSVPFTTTVTIEDAAITSTDGNAVTTMDVSAWMEGTDASVADNEVSFSVTEEGEYEPFAVLGANLNSRTTDITLSYYKADGDERIALDEQYIAKDFPIAYYSDDIIAELLFRNCSREDMEALSVSILQMTNNGEEETRVYPEAEKMPEGIKVSFEEKEEDAAAYYALDIRFENDGAYRIKVSGTENRAGAAASLMENYPDGTEGTPCAVSEYTSPWTLIRDTVNPVLTSLSITPEEGVAHPDINAEYGNRYYFNKGFEIKAVVEDEHLAADRKESGIAFLRAADTSEENSEEVRFEEITAFSDKNESAYTFDGSKAVFTDTVTADGVYAYSIFGTDLAGNPVEFGENVDRETLKALSGGEVSGNSVDEENEALISRHIVVDTKAPTGTLTITAGGKNAYIRDTDRQAPTYSMPYQLADSAEITLVAAESERTPVKVTLTVAEKNGTEETSAESQGFIFHGSAVKNIDGKMIFSVKEGLIEDLAGNVSGTVSSRRIYLDKEETSDNTDVLAPVINIEPVIKDADYDNEGRPLYKGDAQFKISVVEPYSEADETAVSDRASSGIKLVTWQVVEKRDRQPVLDSAGQIYHYANAVSEGGETFADENKVIYAFDNKGEALTVPANEATNRNDLSIILIAEDNAGNRRTSHYDFGIDTTAPSVTVAYDNNDVRNERYFNAPRTATVTVTERNFDPESLAIAVSAKDRNGNEVSSMCSMSDWSARVKNAGTPNGDGDTFERTITFAGDGEYTVSVGPVSDAAGNEGSVTYAEGTAAANDFAIDTSAPVVSVRMDDGSVPAQKDGNYYYRADNCGFKVYFTDNGSAALPEGTSAAFTAELAGGISKSRPTDGTEGALTFTAEEVAAAGDGLHTVKVTAVDAAGNEAEALDAEASSGCAVNGLEGTFVLDTTAPRVTGISTTTENAETDGLLYEDTNSVYYNDLVKVLVTVEDAYALTEDFAGISMKTPAGSADAEESRADVSDSEGVITLAFTMEPNNHYGELRLTGRDLAGNPLVLAEDYARVASGNDDLAESEAGTVVSLHGKTIDDENPKAELSYRSDDRANMYGTEAYYNRDIAVRVSFSDNYVLDGMEAGKALVGAKAVFTPDDSRALLTNETEMALAREEEGRKYTAEAWALSEEGHYTFALAGSDRAGNPIIVTEMKPWTDSTGEDVPEAPVTGEYFGSKYELVLDKTAPTFRLSVSSPSAANQGLNRQQGNRYYFSSGFTAQVLVSDVNFDADRISVKRGQVTDGLYDSSAVKIASYGVTVPNMKNENTGEATVRYTDTVGTDGVYRYAVYGSDKAGNALIAPQGAMNLDGTDTAAVSGADEAKRGSLETEADTSNHIVIDTVKPAGAVSITNASGAEYYRMLTNGNVEKAEPYRNEQRANVNLSVDINKERTPVRLDYAVTAQPSAESQSGSTGNYAYNSSLTVPVDGRQQFKVTKYALTDLAGNSAEVSSGNFIFLDRDDLPRQDRLAPVTAIRAAAPSSVRDGNGQDLFNGDVTLSLKITDPYGGRSSSGLADIYYEIYVGEDRIDAATMLHTKNTEHTANNYRDPALAYVHEQQVTVPAASHNYNNLRFVVTAYDNAGNFSTNEYRFGIDITPPSVRVEYDNNDAQNDRYFRADRVATVTVTERNFNPAAVNIATESSAAISGWEPHMGDAPNGDNDTWTCTVAYRVDGNYTFSVSAADLLGWQAGAPTYVGTAPQDFVLDKTAPVLSVSYDNNDAANEKYYKADRTATISAADVNFEGTNDITVTASEGGSAPGVSFSGMSASLPFTADGVYSFGGTVTDMAGNVSNRIDEPEFVIDKTMPEITLSGVDDLSANANPLTITLTMSDTNMNENGISAVLNGTNRGEVDADGVRSRGEGGVMYVFEVTEDDYYKLTYTATDLAGNSVTRSISFSENQNGTVFEFLGPVGKNGYALTRFRPEYVLTNVDEVTILSVTLNGQEAAYTYENDRLTFREELPSDGKYVITVDVTDAAGNMRSDRQEFIVDTKAPRLTVIGLSDDGLYFEEFVITLRRESLTDEFLEIWMDGEELTEGEGKGHYTVAENGDVYITVSEYAAHELYVKVRDEAGNVTMWPEQEERILAQILAKSGIAARSVTQEMKPYEFRLTNSILLRWYSNKPVFFISLVPLAGLFLIILLFLKRRKDEEKEKRA